MMNGFRSVLYAGRVDGNSISFHDEPIMTDAGEELALYQALRTIDKRNGDVRLIGDKYLAINASFNGINYILDSNTFDPMHPDPEYITTLGYGSQILCTDMAGPLSLYCDTFDSLLYFGMNKQIRAYCLDSQKSGSFTQVQHLPVSVFWFQGKIGLIEMEDGIRYLEMIDCPTPGLLQLQGKTEMQQ